MKSLEKDKKKLILDKILGVACESCWYEFCINCKEFNNYEKCCYSFKCLKE